MKGLWNNANSIFFHGGFFLKIHFIRLRCAWIGGINLKIFSGYKINYLRIWPFTHHPWFSTRKASKLRFVCFQLQLFSTMHNYGQSLISICSKLTYRFFPSSKICVIQGPQVLTKLIKPATNPQGPSLGQVGSVGRVHWAALILKLWRQKSRPFGPDWSANITRIPSWTFRLPCI